MFHRALDSDFLQLETFDSNSLDSLQILCNDVKDQRRLKRSKLAKTEICKQTFDNPQVNWYTENLRNNTPCTCIAPPPPRI